MTEIIVAGYPKSGNTWLARLMGDLMNFPITGIDNAIPIAAEGADRTGDGLVRQLHLMPAECESERFIASPHTVNPDRYNGECILHIIRDPRDVAVSINAYWEIGDLARTIVDVMGKGSTPMWGRSWCEYLESWRTSTLPYMTIYYDELREDTAGIIRTIASAFNLTPARDIGEVIERQSFDVRRAEIEQNGDSLPYGKSIQLKNMRGGRAGDWRTAFSFRDAYLAETIFADLLHGFEKDREWYLRHEVPELFVRQIAEWYCGDFGDPLHNPRMTKSLGLFQLSRLVKKGDIVELGTYHGNGAIALASGARAPVYTIDDYAPRTDWAGQAYNPDDRAICRDFIERSGLPVKLIEQESSEAAINWPASIGLLYWDLWGADRLRLDFELWGGKVVPGGLFVMHDTADYRFGSDTLMHRAVESGEWKTGMQLPFLSMLVKR